MELSLNMLLNKRDYDNLAFTKNIIALFSANLTKAVQMFYKYDRDVKWTHIERFDAVDGYVLVKGEVEVRPGDVLTLPEGEVMVDDKNIHLYTRPLYYALNGKVLQHGTVEDLFQHVSFVDEVSKTLPEAEVIKVLRSGAVSANVVMENPTLKPILEKITRPTSFESFDTSTLSEEQFNSLRQCANIGKTPKPH